MHGQKWIEYIQKETDRHLERVHSLCNMPDDEVLMMENSRTTTEMKHKLSKIRLHHEISIRTLEKPNLHRLLELMRTTLPMVGHVAHIGELSLEKAHKLLKRAIRQSNNKYSQLQAMNRAIFTDWQRRMAMWRRKKQMEIMKQFSAASDF